MLGELHAVSGAGYAMALLLVAVTTVLWVRLQSVVLKLRASQSSSRWASNVRDLIGLFAAAAMSTAFHLSGLPWAAALLFAGTLGVVLELSRRGDRLRPTLTLVIALAFALAISVWPSAALSGANHLAEALMGDRATSTRARG